MHTETHLLTKKNKILILGLFIVLLLMTLIVLHLNIDCLFKSIFHISCPACGMTRALKLILEFKILESFKYNILTFPLCLLILTLFIIFIYDIITGKNKLKQLTELLIKNYIFIIIIIIISWIINIYRNI
jgi:Protein of unknown function (DUF2752).